MPKRRTSADLWKDLPERVFISHAYADARSIASLLKKLPKHVSPVVWKQRSDPDPANAVSEGVVAALRACEGLIWLAGGESAQSFWVAFERDYALRAGLSVYAYSPDSGALHRTTASPVPLRVEVLVSEAGMPRADALLVWMKDERSFEFDARPRVVRLKEIPRIVATLIHEGRIAVWLMDEHMGAVAEYALEVPPDMLGDAYRRLPGASNVRGENEFENHQEWLVRHSMYVRLTAGWLPKAERDPAAWQDPETRHLIRTEFPIERAVWLQQVLQQQNRSRRSYDGLVHWMVDLVSTANPRDIDWERADDLIVQLTHMLRNAEPFFEDEADENGT